MAVDTLLGLSTDLWPIIHRLSHLISFKTALEAAVEAGQTSKATVLRTELENTSQAIELALTKWEPALGSRKLSSQTEPPSSSSASDADVEELIPDALEEARIQSIRNNAEAYRHSAFVYLHRTIHSQPRRHPSVQKHAHLALQACASVVANAQACPNGPMSALLWPLFVAACEAVTPADRDLADTAFGGTERRQRMNNIARAWEVVREVWRRADLGEAGGGDEEVDWRGVCAEKGYNIVFG